MNIPTPLSVLRCCSLNITRPTKAQQIILGFFQSQNCALEFTAKLDSVVALHGVSAWGVE